MQCFVSSNELKLHEIAVFHVQKVANSKIFSVTARVLPNKGIAQFENCQN